MVDVRNARFFRWYRTLPLTLMAAMLTLSLTVDLLPIDLVRSLFFPVSYAERIDDAAERYDVDEHLIAAIIRCESGWNERALSSAGAVGLMQIMPDTARSVADQGRVDTNHFDPNDLSDPATNIEYGTALLAFLQSQLESVDQVICAYNAGLGTVQGWLSEGDSEDFADVVTYPETMHYLERVKEALRQYSRYYPSGMSTL